MILQQCHPFQGDPAFRLILVKLEASKEEVEVAKVVEKALKNQTKLKEQT